jgi:hypothetical protein
MGSLEPNLAKSRINCGSSEARRRGPTNLTKPRLLAAGQRVGGGVGSAVFARISMRTQSDTYSCIMDHARPRVREACSLLARASWGGGDSAVKMCISYSVLSKL